MATKFTPISTAQPQQSGEIDNLISAIQSMRQMRKQMKKDEWDKQVQAYRQLEMARTQSGWAKEDEAERSAAEFQGRITNMLANPQPQGGHTMADVQMLATQGKMTDEQYGMLMQTATDYVPESDKRIAFASRLGEITDIPMLEKAIKETGIYPNDAYRMMNEHQQLNKPTGGKGGGGSGGGKGEGGSAMSADLIYSQAQDMNKVLQMRSKAGYVINGVAVKAKGKSETPAISIKDADGYEWQLTNKGVYVWANGRWQKANKSGKEYKSTKGRNLVLPEGYARALEDGYSIYQESMIGGKGKSVIEPGQAVNSLIGDY